MASEKKSGESSSRSAKSSENILAGFQALRNEQKMTADKLSEMEMELNEHKIVIDALKNVDPKKKCYRKISGVLCESTVGEVLPALASNKEQITKVIETLNDQLTKKGLEINEYIEKNNIKFGKQSDLLNPEDDSKNAKKNQICVNPLKL